jgi:DNA-binding protein H-NS
MKGNDFKSMSIDELWHLHEEVTVELSQKIQSEKTRLEQRLRQLQGADKVASGSRTRRPYPPVPPKYRNPKNPSETWSGRGKEPRWLRPQLRAGRRLDDFLIDRASEQKRHQTGLADLRH